LSSVNIAIELILAAPYFIAPAVTIQSILASFNGNHTSALVGLVNNPLVVLIPTLCAAFVILSNEVLSSAYTSSPLTNLAE